MGLERENRKRKISKHDGHVQDLKKKNRQQELLHPQVVIINGKQSKKSSRSMPGSYVDEKADIIIQSVNLPSSSNSSLSVNLPSSSHSSFSIYIPHISHPSLSLKIPSSNSDSSFDFDSTSASTSVCSSNTPPSFQKNVLDDKLSTSKELKKESQEHTLKFSSPESVQESYLFDLNSIVQSSPPIHQVMDRSSTGGGGYDPSRVPLAIFEKKIGSPVEWSINSNDSLFSLNLEKKNSISRDRVLSLGELSKVGDVEFALSPPPPNSIEETSLCSEKIEANGEANDIGKDATNADDHKNGEEEKKIDSNASSKSIKTSGGSEDSLLSSVFPIFANGERAHYQQHSKTRINSPSATKRSRKSASRSCFYCFSWSCSSCHPRRCCSSCSFSSCCSFSCCSCHQCTSCCRCCSCIWCCFSRCCRCFSRCCRCCSSCC